MKKIGLLVMIIIPIYLFSQDRAEVEIATQTENFNSSDIIYFTIELHSQYSTAWYIPRGEGWEIDPNPQSAEEIIIGNHTGIARGFQVYPEETDWEPFWHALNKVTIFVNPIGVEPKTEWFYFYIDHRDCGFRDITTDHTFRYDKDNADKIYYAPGLPIDTYFWTICDSVNEGEVINIWELLDFGSHDISCMCATPSLISITNYYNRPKVLWRRPIPSNWSLVATVTDTSYVDNEIYIGDGSWSRAYYKIRAKIDDLNSGYSDYGYIDYEGIDKPVVQNNDKVEITEFKLQTNYPNPFNPSTKISFNILEQSPVELSVYDIRGQKLITLVNETLDRGNYSVEFNASQLPSGTYLYKIVAGEFTDTQKMILVK
jgi:hypothetical protein